MGSPAHHGLPSLSAPCNGLGLGETLHSASGSQNIKSHLWPLLGDLSREIKAPQNIQEDSLLKACIDPVRHSSHSLGVNSRAGVAPGQQAVHFRGTHLASVLWVGCLMQEGRGCGGHLQCHSANARATLSEPAGSTVAQPRLHHRDHSVSPVCPRGLDGHPASPAANGGASPRDLSHNAFGVGGIYPLSQPG